MMHDTKPLKKFDDELQIVWGEVYAPGIPDSQGDFMSAEEIRKMAYDFMLQGKQQMVDVNHDNQLYGCCVVETFIARDDDSVFIPQSWVVGVCIPDATLWGMVKSGELNGFSLQGLAVTQQTTLTLTIPEKVTGETTEANGHVHRFTVRFSADGSFQGGETDTVDGHSHKIVRGTVTETVSGHSHRFSFVEDLIYANG